MLGDSAETMHVSFSHCDQPSEELERHQREFSSPTHVACPHFAILGDANLALGRTTPTATKAPSATCALPLSHHGFLSCLRLALTGNFGEQSLSLVNDGALDTADKKEMGSSSSCRLMLVDDDSMAAPAWCLVAVS